MGGRDSLAQSSHYSCQDQPKEWRKDFLEFDVKSTEETNHRDTEDTEKIGFEEILCKFCF
jgi:hypothetical protein